MANSDGVEAKLQEVQRQLLGSKVTQRKVRSLLEPLRQDLAVLAGVSTALVLAGWLQAGLCTAG